jgi:hypothetical protein
MADSRSGVRNEGRRRLVKALGAAGLGIVGLEALPRKWTKPVLDSVTVPLHARGTVMDKGGGGNGAAAVD